MICAACGSENAESAKFCSECGTPLAAPAAAREERKVVTCLFCDLVGFTARAESMDPEDVRRLLQPYHARLRFELERFGGTVEKFIGDAVMAVFGAPVAHEDDPERALRAALSIRDSLAEEGELEVRIGITTGEALVALGARTERGEGMASGDVVNTAARLQTAAPVNGILVDETTYRATERAVEYEDGRAIEVKGKAEPLAVWEVRRARARVAVERVGGAPLVGREQELTLVRETFARVIREREPQLVTLVGVPGIGKSRLVFELFQAIEAGAYGQVFWRHGRSLSYGESMTFWALGEIVKAQAGILESDGSDQAAEKLRKAVERFVADPADAAWIEDRLRPLVGLEAAVSSGDRRDETFAAWRSFVEAIADERPLVVVFEDLHWADDALLDFVDYLVERASGVPLLVLGTARPELLSRRPDWGGGKVNASTLQLSSLTEDETGQLLHALLGRSALDADLQRRLLDHAGGNPLYAEEFTRMLATRPGEVVLPETVQGIIAARLDTLPLDEKELLQDAAVIGRVFWLGALGRERWTLEERLHALERKGFVARERRSAVAGESEYSFRHALVREVAYEQIPRGERAGKHQLAAKWIRSLGRVDDHADMLAHHYLRAVELARAAGQPVVEVSDAARQALAEAGARAFSLNSFGAAARYYGEALALDGDTDDRDTLRYRRAQALFLAGDPDAEAALEAARAASLASGDSERAAEADTHLSELWWHRADSQRSWELLMRAHGAVGDRPSSPSKAYVLSHLARHLNISGAHEEAVQRGREALALAEALELPELRVHTLSTIGSARVSLGDPSGLDDVEQAVESALSTGSSEVVRALNNLAIAVLTLGDLRRARKLIEDSLAHAERLGMASMARFAGNVRLWLLFQEGDWNAVLPATDEFLAACDAGVPHYQEGGMRIGRAMIRLARDDVDGALDDVRKVVRLARDAGDPQQRVPWLGGCARVYVESGRSEEARPLAREALQPAEHWAYINVAFVAGELACGEELCELLERGPRTPWVDAMQAVLRNDFVVGADALTRIGHGELAAVAHLTRRRTARRRRATRRGRRAPAARARVLALGRTRRATSGRRRRCSR